MKTLVIIPSRLSASRLPGKPLLKINGLSIISHVYKKAQEANVGEVFVAAEDQEIIDDVKKNGGEAILTHNNHKTGTDRIYEAFEKLGRTDIDLIMNLQGDEPLMNIEDIQYINAHGTSTPVGDVGEIEAVRRVFGLGSTPLVSSTKSMTGHSQGATGAQEAIYCLLMLKHDFIAPSININQLDPELKPFEIASSLVKEAKLDTVMTNSFGFGGTNGSMLLSNYKD